MNLVVITLFVVDFVLAVDAGEAVGAATGSGIVGFVATVVSLYVLVRVTTYLLIFVAWLLSVYTGKKWKLTIKSKYIR